MPQGSSRRPPDRVVLASMLFARFSFHFAGRFDKKYRSVSQFDFFGLQTSKAIPFMNHVLRYCVSTGIVGLFLASTCHAGVDSSPANARQTHEPFQSTACSRSRSFRNRPAREF